MDISRDYMMNHGSSEEEEPESVSNSSAEYFNDKLSDQKAEELLEK